MECVGLAKSCVLWGNKAEQQHTYRQYSPPDTHCDESNQTPSICTSLRHRALQRSARRCDRSAPGKHMDRCDPRVRWLVSCSDFPYRRLDPHRRLHYWYAYHTVSNAPGRRHQIGDGLLAQSVRNSGSRASSSTSTSTSTRASSSTGVSTSTRVSLSSWAGSRQTQEQNQG